jgi:hypothetical protein
MAAATERAFVAQPIASAGGRVITSPFQFYTSGEDHLRVTSVNSLTGVALKVRGRFVDNSGLILPLEHDHTPATNRTTVTTTIGLGVGAVLNLDVFASAGAPSIGQTFVVVQLVRGMGASGLVLGTLLQGYVTSSQHLAWPGSPLESSLEGQGAIRQIIGTNPAANVEITEFVPVGARWRVITFIAALATSAVVASRVPYLASIVNGSTTSLFPPAASIPASFTQYLQFCTGYTTWVVGGVTAQAASLPTELLLPSGSALQTYTELMQAGDDWSGPTILVEEWLEVN